MTVKLIVLAKEPLPGRVKTRLCPPYSQEQAAELASAAIADTMDAVVEAVFSARLRGLSVEPVLALEGSPGSWMPASGARFRVIPQCEGGLDVRLAGAFDEAIGDEPESSAMLIGMDTPQVSPHLLVDAIEMLSRADTDAVLGLADDGGWWGMGLRHADRSLLVGVPMSTDETGYQQHLRLSSAGLRVGLLPMLRDVDTVDDAHYVATLSPQTRFAATLNSFHRAALTSPVLPAAS